MNNLGFGTMRLPLRSDDPTDFDYPQLNQMVDAFLEAGHTYFDTSYVYHNGKSEKAVRTSLVERHPRESFTLATKFPTFMNVAEDQIEGIFAQQLENLGTDYIDYYLLHNVQTVLYDGIDGKGGVIPATHLFDHAKAWKTAGRIKHLGISLHSSAALLDRVLTEHPEIDFVQLAVNPIDWDSEFVQAAECYECARRHGKKVVIMEAVKGGGLAKLPEEAERLLKAIRPEKSIASWSLRFCLEMEDVIAVLSGMSDLEQMRDNLATCAEAEPLSNEERAALWKAMAIYRASAPMTPDEMQAYRGILWNGVPATAILQAWAMCVIQPNPGFADDNNYFKNALAECAHLDIADDLPACPVTLPNGEDGTAAVEKAAAWLKEHSF
ncbi:aldo/keto reductase [Adlercreutzia sp. R25]|uniref:aldo/keto reductase n=1 Tax=Adlercreutzia shanghongiae TaxID=3111773 RepID=UPI002DBFA83B|nr:aldo/keto reductase [Adlercreutzia sp. R25]MEC4271919.1 aldo/keto reductase [Adlercreutzia sp. R25]